MREILFRGKSIIADTPNTPEYWLEGNFIVSYYAYHIAPMYKTYLDLNEDSEVWPETVGQWTGKHDKNGKKIFEGDIVTVAGVAYVCRWDEGNVEFGLVNEKESFGIAYVVPNVEVIGNIHDNPELLKGE